MKFIRKCQDLMIGIAIGDAFGAGYENLPPSEVLKRFDMTHYDCYPFNSGHKAGHYTDDTQMSVAVAKALYSACFSAQTLADSFVREYNTNKIIGYSREQSGLLKRSETGKEFLEQIKHSDKNGGVMRVLPIGVQIDIRKVMEDAVVNAQVGYNTDKGIASSVAIALASHYFFHALGPVKEMFEFCLDNMRGFDKESVEYLTRVSDMQNIDPNILFGDDCGNQGVPLHGLKTAGAALYILSRYHDDPMETLRQAVLLGGDTDTTASICLGIVYSRMSRGLDQFLFDDFQKGPYGLDYIKSVGTRLATMLPMDVESKRRLNYSGERKSMIVQTLDGLLEPLDPIYLNQIMTQLFRQIDYRSDDIILAVDASGYIPATAASIATGLNLATSKKADLDVQNKIKFHEPGTPNPDVFIYSIPDNHRVIIVDDEIMTGRTIINASEAIKQKGHEILAVVVPVESIHYGARTKLGLLGIPFISHTRHDMS